MGVNQLGRALTAMPTSTLHAQYPCVHSQARCADCASRSWYRSAQQVLMKQRSSMLRAGGGDGEVAGLGVMLKG